MTSADDSPYHEAERAIQERLGLRERAEMMGRRMIRAYMPDEHRELFEELPFVLVGALDGQGWPWASLLFGAPGFMRSPDPRTLIVRALPHADDPLAAGLACGGRVGLLAIQLETRRRNRMNGRVVARSRDEFAVHVEQSFGNCPQYINARVPIPVEQGEPEAAQREGALLSQEALALIAASDTCFIASAFSSGATNVAREGVDVSHRGGRPGFVGIGAREGTHSGVATTQSVLTVPDFAGNNAFNTIGNLAHYPRAGLLFVDFARGDMLSLSAEAEVIWDGDEVAQFVGAKRLVRFVVREGRFFRAALPFRWTPPEPAAQLARTGSFSDGASASAVQGTSSEVTSPT